MGRSSSVGLPALNEAGLGSIPSSFPPGKVSTGRGMKAMIPRAIAKQKMIPETTQQPRRIVWTKPLHADSVPKPRQGKLGL